MTNPIETAAHAQWDRDFGTPWADQDEATRDDWRTDALTVFASIDPTKLAQHLFDTDGSAGLAHADELAAAVIAYLKGETP